MSENERRYKLMYVDENVMIDMLTNAGPYPVGNVRMPRFRTLPQGFRVAGVNYSFEKRAFAVCIHHPSYRIAVPGESLEEIEPKAEMRTFDMKLIRAWAKEHPNG